MVNRVLSYRERIRLAAAVTAVQTGMTVRAAEKKFRIARSTIHRLTFKQTAAVAAAEHRDRGHPRAFVAEEEKVIVDLLCRYAERGIPLSRDHLKEAFALFIARLPMVRQVKLPFHDGRPGPKFLRGFTRRNKDRLRYVRPLVQEGKRFAAVNA